MTTRKFLRSLGIICFIPAMFAVIFVFVMFMDNKTASYGYFFNTVLIIGLAAFILFIFTWVLLITCDKALWMTREELYKSTQAANKAKELYDDALVTLKFKILNDLLAEKK